MDMSVLDRRLQIVAAHFGWSPERVEGYRSGFELARSDPATMMLPDSRDFDLGFECRRLYPGQRHAQGKAEGIMHAQAIERYLRFPAMTQDEAMRIVRYEAEAGDGAFSPDDADWTIDDALDISRLCRKSGDLVAPDAAIRDDWIRWLAREHRAHVREGSPGFADLVLEDIHQPAVIALYQDSFFVWDGWHRTGATFMKGESTMRAIWCRSPVPDPAKAVGPGPGI